MNLQHYLENASNEKEIKYWKTVVKNKDLDMLIEPISLLNKILTKYQELFDKSEDFKSSWIANYEKHIKLNHHTEINQMMNQAKQYVKQIIQKLSV